MTSFLSKRYLGPPEGLAKKSKNSHRADSNTLVLETNPIFKTVYRDLATDRVPASTATDTSVEGLSWLAELQAAAAPKAKQSVETEAAPLPTVRAENFWRPDKLEEDFHEQRSFVRNDCKAQLQATKRKLKLRLFTYFFCVLNR